jgi:MATE family multidrug resistance protein
MVLSQDLRSAAALALPVTLARAGLVLMLAVDTVLAGRVGKDQLAFLGISMGPLLIMVTVGSGLLVGALILTAQAHGAGRLADCGRIWRLSLRAAGMLGLLYAALQWQGTALLRLLGEDDLIARGGGSVLAMWALGMPGAMLYTATASFMEGISRPRPAVAVSLGANVVNLALGWALVFGHAGLPAMGAAGAALATSITLWLMFMVLGICALRQRDAAELGIRHRLDGQFRIVGRMLLLGMPVALSVGFETTAFSGSSVIAGWRGATTLAAFQLANTVITIFYVLSLGIGTAATVRVGNAVGRADGSGAAAAGWAAVRLVGGLMLAGGIAVALWRGGIAGVYTMDADVKAEATAALAWISLFIFFDGIQTVLMGALRGAGDVMLPTLAYAAIFGGCAIPLSYYLGYSRGGGAAGLVLGTGVGVALAAVILALRFAAVARRARQDPIETSA